MPGVERIGGIETRQTTVRSRSAGGFTVDAAGAERQAAPLSAAAPSALGLLTALQDADEPVQDRAARRHGRAVLAALSQLQGRVLLGDPGSVAGHLAELLAEAPPPKDPDLAVTLQAVLLRARIELARYGGWPGTISFQVLET